MNSKEMMGLLLCLYVVAFGAWAFMRYDDIAISKKLHPGREQEAIRARQLMRITVAWIAGLPFLIFGADASDPNPLPIAGAAAIASILGYLAARPSFFRMPRRRATRFWWAGSTVWVLSVLAWCVITEREISERLALVFLPPLIAALGMRLYRWAREGEAG